MKRKMVTVLGSLALSAFLPGAVSAAGPEAAPDPSAWPVVSVDVLSFADTLERRDEVQEALNEYLVSIDAGVQAELIVNFWGDRKNNLALMLSDKDKPLDLFSWRFYSSIDALVKNDQVIPLDAYQEAYPELFSMLPEKAYLVCQIDGRQYSLPNADSFGNFTAYLLRRSVAREIGVEDLDGQEITFEELNEILIKAEEAFPDQAWWADMKPVSLLGIDTLGDDYWLGVLMNRGIDQTEIVNYYETEEFRQWCEQARWYNDNGMVPEDPENTVPTGNLYQDRIISGRYVDGYSIDYIRSMMHGQGYTGEGDFILMKLNDYVGTNSCVYNGWCISSLCKNPDAAMKLLYLMATDEKVCRYFTLGIEGVTYEVDANGCAWMADGVEDSTVGWNLSAPWMYPNQCLSLPYNTDFSSYYSDMEACWSDEDSKFSDGMGFNFDTNPVYGQIKACQNLIDQYRQALLYGEVEVDEYLDRLNKELESAGIQEIIEEKNRQFAGFLEKNGQ